MNEQTGKAENPVPRAETVIACRDLRKIYSQGPLNVLVLNGIKLEIARGESVAITGASGSGKSTLLHLLGGLDEASAGSVSILGQEVEAMNEVQRGNLRNRNIGFVYQFHHLL
ncbi:MAG TPA: ATP-binding cassette domain-containing protein, partial [Gallionellaceae bacterium]|nr:ATP-binding cassette domain-containing protein [Gallionellaceae bacterium]